MDIHNRDFKRATIRGYKEEEVDEFLDRVVVDYEKLFRENDKLKEQASLHEKEISQFRKLEKNLQDTLMVAQSTAEEVISAAKKNADEAVNNARIESQNIREQAQIDARRHIEEANNKLRSLNDEYEKLLREKNTFLLKIRTALETELAVTNQLLSTIPQPKHESIELRQSSMMYQNQPINQTQSTIPNSQVKVNKVKEEMQSPVQVHEATKAMTTKGATVPEETLIIK